MTTKLNTSAAILAFLATIESATVVQIAKAIGKSESVVRENLVKLTKANSVGSNQQGRMKVFYVPDAKPAKKEKARKARVKGAILPTSGKGHPGAKKVVNPQPTLELKKLAVRQAKGSMTWANRTWHIAVNGKEMQMSSRELASLSIGDLCKNLGIAVPTSSIPAAA